MPGNTTAQLYTQLAGCQVQLIMKSHHICGRYFQKSGSWLHGITTRIHVGLWLQRQNALAINGAFRHFTLEALPPGAEAVAPRNLLQRHEADIVPLTRVLRPWIAKADPKHRGAVAGSHGIINPKRARGRLPPDP